MLAKLHQTTPSCSLRVNSHAVIPLPSLYAGLPEGTELAGWMHEQTFNTRFPAVNTVGLGKERPNWISYQSAQPLIPTSDTDPRKPSSPNDAIISSGGHLRGHSFARTCHQISPDPESGTMSGQLNAVSGVAHRRNEQKYI